MRKAGGGEEKDPTFERKNPLMEASFCHASIVGYVAAETHDVVVDVEVWAQGQGRSLFRVLSLRKSEHRLAIPE